MKTAIKIFLAFGRFRIEGRKWQNSDFQSHFSMSKIDRILFNFFSKTTERPKLFYGRFHSSLALLINH